MNCSKDTRMLEMLRMWRGNCSYSLELIQERVHICCWQQNFADGVTQVCWRPYDVTINYQMLDMKLHGLFVLLNFSLSLVKSFPIVFIRNENI